jgi:hypothetical protein
VNSIKFDNHIVEDTKAEMVKHSAYVNSKWFRF